MAFHISVLLEENKEEKTAKTQSLIELFLSGKWIVYQRKDAAVFAKLKKQPNENCVISLTCTLNIRFTWGRMKKCQKKKILGWISISWRKQYPPPPPKLNTFTYSCMFWISSFLPTMFSLGMKMERCSRGSCRGQLLNERARALRRREKGEREVGRNVRGRRAEALPWTSTHTWPLTPAGGSSLEKHIPP